MKTRVAMMFGGKSVEHEVSVITGIQALLSMDTEQYDAIPVYLTKQNEMYVGEDIGKIECYKELINRFSDKINPGEIYFYLGDCYGQAGQWDLAAQSYKKFLSYPEATIPGNSSAREYATDFEAYYNTRVTWSYASLDELISKVSAAMKTRKSSEINKYTSKVKFFMSSWEEQEASQEALAMNNIGSFINSSTRINKELDKISNAQEAYLKTSGWDFRMNTWYFYFRKINFPANPEIHGNWEWAGIYLGDRVFSRSNE